MLHETSFQIINMYSIGGQNRASELVTLATRGVVWILRNLKDLLDYIQSRTLSSCNSIKTFDFSTLYATIPPSKLKDRLRELVELCFKNKRMANVNTNTKKIGKDRSYFVKKKHTLILPKSSLKLISSTCLSFWFDNIFVIFGGQTVLHFSPTCSLIHTRQTSYRGFSRKR